MAAPGLPTVTPGIGEIMCMPVSVCHQVSTTGVRSSPDVLAVPDVGLGVDRLADRAEDPQRGQVEAVRDVGAPLHEGADGGRRAVEDRDAVLLDELPPAALVRGVGGALVHDAGGAVDQRPVDQVGVPGHPADVGRGPEDVGLGLEVEGRPVGVGGADQVAAGGVQDALRLPGAAGGVHDVERVLGREELRRRARWTGRRRSSCHQRSRPSVIGGLLAACAGRPARAARPGRTSAPRRPPA